MFEYSEEEIKKILRRVMSSEKASDELKKQAGKLVKAMELLSERNLIVVTLVVSGVITYLVLYEKYIMAFAVLAFIIIACIVSVVRTRNICAKIKTALSKQVSSSSD